MGASNRRGFDRREIAGRYDVTAFEEDTWHSYADAERAQLIKRTLSDQCGSSGWLLNAGSGVYSLNLPGWREVRLDLFWSPIMGAPFSVCGSILNLPFSDFTFGAIACIGEVLGYCDPAQAISELSRVLMVGGVLIFDFASTRSPRFWLTPTFGRAADIVTVEYNGCPERIWAYDPAYVKTIVQQNGLSTTSETRIMGWATAIQRAGIKQKAALYADAIVNRWIGNNALGDLIVICAQRNETGKSRL